MKNYTTLQDIVDAGLVGEVRKARKKTAIRFVRMTEPFTCNTLEGDDIHGKAGDILAIGIKGELYPIDAEIFADTYDEIPMDELC